MLCQFLKTKSTFNSGNMQHIIADKKDERETSTKQPQEVVQNCLEYGSGVGGRPADRRKYFAGCSLLLPRLV